jgi:ribonuclease HI
MKQYEIFTDGACSGNPGPGGFGVLLRNKITGKEETLSGSDPHTTNNRMELLAVIFALEYILEPSEIDITTDSKYVHDGISVWLPNWKKRNWKTASGSPVKNIELWQRLEKATQKHKIIKWHWIRGHNGHRENEIADSLAREAIEKLK